MLNNLMRMWAAKPEFGILYKVKHLSFFKKKKTVKEKKKPEEESSD